MWVASRTLWTISIISKGVSAIGPHFSSLQQWWCPAAHRSLPGHGRLLSPLTKQGQALLTIITHVVAMALGNFTTTSSIVKIIIAVPPLTQGATFAIVRLPAPGATFAI